MPTDTHQDGIGPSIVIFPPIEIDVREVGSIFPRTFLALRSCLTPTLKPYIGIIPSVVPAKIPAETFPVSHLATSVFHATLIHANGCPSREAPVPRLKESPFKI